MLSEHILTVHSFLLNVVFKMCKIQTVYNVPENTKCTSSVL